MKFLSILALLLSLNSFGSDDFKNVPVKSGIGHGYKIVGKVSQTAGIFIRRGEMGKALSTPLGSFDNATCALHLKNQVDKNSILKKDREIDFVDYEVVSFEEKTALVLIAPENSKIASLAITIPYNNLVLSDIAYLNLFDLQDYCSLDFTLGVNLDLEEL